MKKKVTTENTKESGGWFDCECGFNVPTLFLLLVVALIIYVGLKYTVLAEEDEGDESDEEEEENKSGEEEEDEEK